MSATQTETRSGAIDAGVIEEARGRQRRRRSALAALALVGLAGTLIALQAGGGGTNARPARATPRPPGPRATLAGTPLAATTPLRLVVAENGAAVSIVDVGHGTVLAVRGLAHGDVTLSAYRGGVLADVTHWTCPACRGGAADFPNRQTDYLIEPDGSARPIASFALGRHDSTTAAFRSDATWVLYWPHRGPCTLRLEPGVLRTVRVPCGDLGPATAQGLWLWNGNVGMLVDPVSGRVRERLSTPNALTVLPGGLALESPYEPTTPRLVLLDIATGARRPLGWPSIFNFGFEAFPEPHGPLVAIEFGEPYLAAPNPETINQGTDVWVLNTRTGAFTHVPGFPIRESIKISGLAWTAGDQLVAVALGESGPGAIGLWRPGQRTIRVGAVPRLIGYSQTVPLRG